MKQKSFNTFLYYTKFFSRTLSWKFPTFLFVSLTAGLSEGFGFFLLIPLLSQSKILISDDFFLNSVIRRIFQFFNLEISTNNVLLLMFIMFTMNALLKGCQNVFRIYIASTIKREWKNKILSLCYSLEYQYFINNRTGHFSNIIIKEVERAVGAFSLFCSVIISIINIAIYLFFSAFLSWKLTTACLLLGIISVLFIKKLFHLTSQYSSKTTSCNSLLQENLIQMLHSFKYLKATSCFNKLQNKLTSIINTMFTLEMKQGVVIWILKTLLELSVIWLVLVVIFYQVSIQGDDISSIMVIVMFFYKTMRQINVFPARWNGFLSNSGGLFAVESLFKDLHQNTERVNGVHIQNIDSGIKLINVDFYYGEKQILYNINMTIKKNQTIAFIGESGAGKSTSIDLISGILKPNSGSITINNIDYSSIDLHTLREKIGYVTQEIIVYNDTIANNVSLWDQSLTENEKLNKIKDSISKAHCEDFILANEKGYNASIGDRGVKLSVGQRQRISIARELYKDVELLLFDEATSALDTKSEQYIQQSINELKHSMTIILIAHRLSTIKNCDYIYVFGKGKIIEEGSYTHLYNNTDSIFRQMCEMQSFAE